ncbi:MAG: SpoIIE family protein phosphatase [Paludibacteraceae bacterium]|nr:SpoIIE family protein phosphatase [Paludibacteraceae bacterium]
MRSREERRKSLGNLALRMSVAVCVTALIILIVGGYYEFRYIYDASLEIAEEDAVDAIDASILSINLKLEQIEAAANSFDLSDERYLNSKECLEATKRFLVAYPDVNTVSVMYAPGYCPDGSECYIVGAAYYMNTDSIMLIDGFKEIDYIHGDDNWEKSGENDTVWWSEPFYSKFHTEFSFISYSKPLKIQDTGIIYGVFNVSTTLTDMEDMMVKLKPDPLCDISLTGRNGMYVCRRDSAQIAQNGDYMSVTRPFPRLGGEITCTFPYKIITQYIKKGIVHIVITHVILLIALIAAIILSVHFIAKPFMKRHKEEVKQNAAMEEDLSIASQMQQCMLPQTLPNQPSLDVYAELIPSKYVGGDIYHYSLKKNKLFFCIGDVCGKGVQASFFMTTIASQYAALKAISDDPAKILKRINDEMSLTNEQCMFCTMFAGVLDFENGYLDYCNAGHNLPILSSVKNGVEWLPGTDDGVIGVNPDATFHTKRIKFEKGDSLLLYTDGVTEAVNTKNEEFGNDATLTAFKECAGKSAKDSINYILQKVDEHTGDALQSDDITMLCVRYL